MKARPRAAYPSLKSRSSDPRVDGEGLFGDHAAVVGGEEQRGARDLFAEQTSS